MSFPNDRTYNFDINELMSDNAAAYTASQYSQVGGAPASFDSGGNQGVTPVLTARMSGVMVCDVTALDVSSTNETYKLLVAVSNDAAFGAGNVAIAGGVEIGAASAALDQPNNVTGVIGRYEIMFTNQVAGTTYEFIRLYIAVGGTTPSINIAASIAVLPEP